MARTLKETKSSFRKLKILMVAAEAAPYVTVGGFASVIGYLSKELISLGHDVRIFIPKFGFIDEEKHKLKTLKSGLIVPTDDETTPELACNVKVGNYSTPVPTYFLENHEYYEKRANVYGYSDDSIRWALLSRGALEFIKIGEFIPDIIHCNDWHTGVLPNYLKTVYKNDPIFDSMSSVFTIHNLQYQGMFDHHHVSEMEYDDGKSLVAPFFSPRLEKQNFMKRGIIYSDAVNTVSKSYSREILTPEFGEGLDKLLLELRGKLFGIVNGIDYNEFNPATDSFVEHKYDSNNIIARINNKKALQREFNLPVKPDVLLLGFVGRLDFMKGTDLLVRTLYPFLKDYDAQFVQVGGGDGGLAEMFRSLQKDFPSKVGIHPYPNFTLPRLVFSGADCMVCPSRFEPCGIVQLEAMRYGSIPIVRNVGGLADTVDNFNSNSETGNGFVFNDFNEFSLFGQLVRAFELYNNKSLWSKLQKNAMVSDYSWRNSAQEYLKLYEKSTLFHKRNVC